MKSSATPPHRHNNKVLSHLEIPLVIRFYDKTVVEIRRQFVSVYKNQYDGRQQYEKMGKRIQGVEKTFSTRQRLSLHDADHN